MSKKIEGPRWHGLTYKQAKRRLEQQIEALLSGDVKRMMRCFEIEKYIKSVYRGYTEREFDERRRLIIADFKGAFGRTPDRLTWGLGSTNYVSLFAMLPKINSCLTMSQASNIERTRVKALFGIDLSQEPLIPNDVNNYTKFTREQLERFADLQLHANFPRQATT